MLKSLMIVEKERHGEKEKYESGIKPQILGDYEVITSNKTIMKSL